MNLKQKTISFLRWSEKYTRTDMVYLARGSFWWILGQICVSFISLAVMIAFSRFLPKQTYGTYKYIISIIAILSIFSLPGIDIALIRTVARGYKKVLTACAFVKLRWSSIGVTIGLLISGWYFWHHNFYLGLSFLIASILLPFFYTFNLFYFFWQGEKRFDIQQKYIIFVNFFAAIVLIATIFLTNNIALIILIYFLSHTIFEAIFFKITLKKITNQELNKEIEKETISFGKHLTLIASINIFSQQLDTIIIWQFLGPISVAIFSFAQAPIQKMQGLIPVAPLALPKLSKKNIKEIKKEIWGKFLKLFFIFLPMAGLLILIAPLLYKILFPQYLQSIPYFQALSLIIALIPFSLISSSLVADMRVKSLYKLSLFIFLLKISLFLILIPLYGIWGIIYAIITTKLLGSLFTLYLFKKL